MVDVDHLLSGDHFPAVFLPHGEKVVGLDGTALHFGQDLVPLVARAAGSAIDQDRPLVVVFELLVGQQARHTQSCITREHTQLGAESRRDSVFAVEFLSQFLGHLVSEGITDHHEDLAVLSLLQSHLHVLVVEAILVGDLVDLPAFEQAGDMLVPRQAQCRDEPVAVGRLDLLAELLEHVPLLGLISVFAEVPIKLVEPVEVFLVGPVHVLSGSSLKTQLVAVAEVKELGGIQ